jgi:hypothetical protein
MARKTGYYWSVDFRNAKGETWGMSSSNIEALLEDALRFNAVAITFFRGHKLGRNVDLSEVRGIFRRRKEQ